MRSLLRTLLVAGGLALPTVTLANETPAPPPAPPAEAKNSCIHARMISGWTRIDDRTLVIRSGARRYLITLVNICRQANWAIGARVDHFGMCLRPGDALVFSSHGHPLGSRWPHWGSRWPERGFEQRCYIQTIEPLPPGWTPPPKK